MPQNVVLRSGSKSLLIAANNSSPFVKFLTEYLGKSQYINPFTVNGVMNNFDNLGREGVELFRGELLEWLWNARGYKVSCVVE
jgi:hypothetical protein